MDRGRRAVAEAIGTFLLVFIGTGAVMVDARSGGALGHVGVSLSFGFVVIGMIYAIGHISGAHINPAVTLGFWSMGRFPAADVAPYVLAQCAGATAASGLLRAALGPIAGLGATVPAVDVPTALAIEAALSFALMFVIAAVATDERVAEGFAGIAVGVTVAFDALMGGPLTGASMNPARSLGPALVAGLWTAHWIYWLAPIGGAVAAARVYEFLRVARSPATEVRARGALGVAGVIEDPRPPRGPD